MGKGSYLGGSSIIHTGRSTEGYKESRRKKRTQRRPQKKSVSRNTRTKLYYIREFMIDVIEAHLLNRKLPRPNKMLKQYALKEFNSIKEMGPYSWFKTQPNQSKIFHQVKSRLTNTNTYNYNTIRIPESTSKLTTNQKKKKKPSLVAKNKKKIDISMMTIINTGTVYESELEKVGNALIKNPKKVSGNVVLSHKQKKEAIKELHKKSGYYDRKIIMVQGGGPGTSKNK